jgi:hypothetical protein
MNDKQFNQIKKYIEKVRIHLGLTEWEIDCYIGGVHSDVVTNACRGRVNYEFGGKVASISLSPFLFEEECPWEWKKTVIHEMLHLLLSGLNDLSSDEKLVTEVFTEREHTVIRRLIDVIYNSLEKQ